MKTAFTSILMVCAMGVAGAAGAAQEPAREKLNTPAKLKLELPKLTPATQPTTRPAASPAAPAANESFVPRLPVRPDKRAARRLAPVREPLAAVELPPLLRAADEPLPGRVMLEEPAPYRAAGAPTMTLRLPNLISTPRRAVWQSNNPSINPAPAASTPTVNNVEGTSALALMPPFTRTLMVEPAPPPRPLEVGEAPYVQAAEAADDADAPVGSGRVPGPGVRME